ncbi:MAG: hypothetical protein IJ471_08315 [Eubacterium sp.]|nr:hypothetical protein [Eubacterium sp.]
MINQEKVKDMTKMAIYESHGGDKELAISAYRRKDYVAMQMLKSFIYGTISFVILLVFYLFLELDRVDNLNSLAQIQSFGMGVLVLYLIFMAVFLCITYFWARKRHNYCSEKAKNYSTELNRVARSYQSAEEEK